eukprot:scaffold225569_cov32-Tisochrysis_lutea.AAC.1
MPHVRSTLVCNHTSYLAATAERDSIVFPPVLRARESQMEVRRLARFPGVGVARSRATFPLVPPLT